MSGASNSAERARGADRSPVARSLSQSRISSSRWAREPTGCSGAGPPPEARRPGQPGIEHGPQAGPRSDAASAARPSPAPPAAARSRPAPRAEASDRLDQGSLAEAEFAREMQHRARRQRQFDFGSKRTAVAVDQRDSVQSQQTVRARRPRSDDRPEARRRRAPAHRRAR